MFIAVCFALREELVFPLPLPEEDLELFCEEGREVLFDAGPEFPLEEEPEPLPGAEAVLLPVEEFVLFEGED